MKVKLLSVSVLLLILLSSCSNDSTNDLITINNNTISYTNSVKSIINNNCLQCHGATPSFGAPMSLTTYEEVRDAVLNRGLIDRISRTEGQSGAMPLGGPKLPQVSINVISQWENEGFLDQ